MYCLTINEVAIKLGLHPYTIQRMCEKERFRGAYLAENGDWMIPEDNFITTRKQDKKSEEILQQIDRKNQGEDTNADVLFVSPQLVADFYEVAVEKVICWIEQGYLSCKELDGKPGKYLVPKEEFEYLKMKRESDSTEEEIKELLGSDYIEDWEVEIEE
ncbi:hypothetical protein HRF69_23825 [Bacillus circulans]|uniref:hypothetical protein n=1 Tax=Bacillaceae TaxID=186817 RepID=UPI0004B37C78|nr:MULTISPECIES: hypothetical protein [Bacillaceae]NRG30113.1 hypothetical protein [Niallia circulans]